ncbi:thioredoxin fold domain-containing protein [bacterium]|nr:thioredoxin fold domain-containing protein [bacterium]
MGQFEKDAMMLRFVLRAMGSLALLGWFWACSPVLATAQVGDLNDLLGGKAPLRSKTPKAEFTAKLTPEAVRPGEMVTLSMTATLPEGFYIYGTDGPVSTRIKFDVTGLEAIGEQWTPDHEGKTAFDPGLQQEVTKFHDKVTWSRMFRVQPDASIVHANGKLEGQYCSGAAGGLCIQILPAFKFDLMAQVMGQPMVVPDESIVSANNPYDEMFRPARGVDSTPDPIEYYIALTPTNAAPGEKVKLAITAKLDAGWHTYALTQEGLGAEPTTIEMLKIRNLSPLGDGFVADRPYVIEKPTDEITLQAYFGEVTWTREFEVTGSGAGDYAIEGEIAYQVCDENQCKPLKTMNFAVGAPLAEGAVVAEADPPSPFGVVEEPEAAVPENGEASEPEGQRIAAETMAILAGEAPEAAQKLQDQALMPFLLLCIGGGFLALLTPCSFPMVPITVGFFLKQSEQNHKRPWVLALVYCGSIVVAFTVLGVGISFLFGATKLNELANNGFMNLIIGSVFVAFGLNMLGAFEIRVPTSLLTWSAMHEGTGSYLGAIFMALTFTLTSFTCTFAVAGTLLVSAAQGNVYWPVLGMMAFGAAFASPFFVLALLPGLLKKLPKSGGWMNSVKVVMGLVEIGAAIKFFGVADLAWNPQPLVFNFAMVMLSWFVLSLTIAMYLFGLFRFAHDTPVDHLSTGRGLLAIVFLGFTGLLGFLILQPERAAGVVMDQVIAFAPPRLNGSETNLGPTLEDHGLLFALNLQQAQPVAAQLQRPLLLDFTGVNCVNCRRMEKKMQQPENKERIGRYVAVQLYADKVPVITDNTLSEEILARNLNLQVNWFGDVSLPSYAVVSPDGKQILAAYIGYERSDGEFTKFLDYGWSQWEHWQMTGRRREMGNIDIAGR